MCQMHTQTVEIAGIVIPSATAGLLVVVAVMFVTMAIGLVALRKEGWL